MIADMQFIPDVLLGLEEAAEAAGWDMPATLYSLHAEQLSGECTAVGVAEFPGFNLAMHLTGHSFHAATALRRSLKVAPPGVRPDLSGLFAVVLVDEAWAVKAKNGDPIPTGSFKDHPGRVEQRFAWLLAADGSSRTLTRNRGDSAPKWVDEWGGGRLSDAVRNLLITAMEGLTRP